METTMTLIYDGQKELMQAKGFETLEELKAWQKETLENDPCTVKCRNADIVIVDAYDNWRVLQLNKPFENFTELKVGRSCKILENGYIKVSDSMFEKISGKYKIVTNF